VTETGFGLVIAFIDSVTARNYKQLQQFHIPTTTHKLVLLFTRQFFIFTTKLPRLSSTDNSRERLSTVWRQSQSYIVTDGRSISKCWCRAPSGAHVQIFITL
jgi:hypothetical protein